MQAATGDPDEQARAEKLYREAAESSPRAAPVWASRLAAKPGAPTPSTAKPSNC